MPKGEEKTSRFDRGEATAFLRAFYGERLEEGDGVAASILGVNYPKPRKGPRTGQGWGDSPDTLADVAEKLNEGADVFFSVCALNRDEVSDQARGALSAIQTVFGVWADIDVADPGKRSKKTYPPTLEEARTLVYGMPFKPSIVVRSGGGWHAYWLFDEPVEVANDEEREEASLLSRGWQRLLQGIAQAEGYDVDGTFDLPRVMRLPGTTHKRLGAVVRVDSDLDDVPRYPPSDLRDMIPATVWETAATAPKVVDVQHKSSNSADGLTVEVEAKIQGAQKDRFILRRLDTTPSAVRVLCEVDAEFEQTWERTRKTLKDQSQSAYDLSLATRLANYGLNVQDIVDACVCHRLQGDPESVKWKRGAYYATLLGKAFEPIVAKRREGDRDLEREQLGDIVTEVSVGDRDKEEAKPQILELLRKFFPGIDQITVAYNPGDPPLWTIRTADSSYTMRGGAADIYSFNAFRAAFGQVTRLTVPPHTAKEWAPIAGAIVAMAVEEKLGNADSTFDEIREWVQAFLGQAPAAKTVDQGLAEELAFRDGGKTWCTARRLFRFVRDVLMVTGVSPKKCASMLKNVGITYEVRAWVDDEGKDRTSKVFPVSRVLDLVPEEPATRN